MRTRRQRTRAPAAVAALLSLLAARPLAAPAEDPWLWSEEIRLVSFDPTTGDEFGWALALDGERVVAGSPFRDHGGEDDAGLVSVLRRAGGVWSDEAWLAPGDGAAGDHFGQAVSLSEDRIAVGAVKAGIAGLLEAGAVYVFARGGSGWREEAKLTASDASHFDAFGHALCLEGATLLVGAPGDDDGGLGSGAAYVFSRSGGTWGEQAKLVAASPSWLDEFGSSVSLSGDRALVGAWGGDIPGASDAGAVYVFARSGTGWSEEARLTASDGAAGDHLGSAVSLCADRALAGAPGDDHAGGLDAGSATVFLRASTGWIEEARLTAGDAAPGDLFGGAVSLSGNRALSGAHGQRHAGAFSGAAYVHVLLAGTWREEARLTALQATAGDRFGHAVALAEGVAVVGARTDDFAGARSGSAPLFVALPRPQSYCSGKTNSLGCVPFLAFVGIPSRSRATPFRIRAHAVLPDEAGFLIYGFGKAQRQFHGGTMCVKAPLSRVFPTRSARAVDPPPCPGVLSSNFNRRIQNGLDPLLTAGRRVFAQWLQRDPADPAGFGHNLSDAITFVIGP